MQVWPPFSPGPPSWLHLSSALLGCMILGIRSSPSFPQLSTYFFTWVLPPSVSADQISNKFAQSVTQIPTSCWAGFYINPRLTAFPWYLIPQPFVSALPITTLILWSSKFNRLEIAFFLPVGHLPSSDLSDLKYSKKIQIDVFNRCPLIELQGENHQFKHFLTPANLIDRKVYRIFEPHATMSPEE